MNRKIIYATTTLLAGFGLITLGGILVIPSTSFSPPSPQDQIRQPTIEVFTKDPKDDILIIADFRQEDSYKLTFYRTTIEDAQKLEPKKDFKPTQVWLRITSFEPFFWSNPIQMTHHNVTVNDEKATTKPTNDSSGSSKYAAFVGTVDNEERIAPSVTVKSARSPRSQSGPYVRYTLPFINTPSIAPAPELIGFEGSQAPPIVNDVRLYAPILNIWATANPWDQDNSDLTPFKMSPSPTYSPPLVWQLKSRFHADILFRDSAWERKAAIKIFFGGLSIGLGTSSLFLPIALVNLESRRSRNRSVR